ncbi:hypothetical protein [Massilia sp. erpn]|uniref:hypothetical protein n=1 Tax=Massilia sp. erpn TaxID=2738142 RepID=UPI002105246D|nr:hypothetical protein [Massilia sp. erpn]UTY60098.1 hypothetical protein HPQ68_24665 [Massilia sp. erpn]
MSIDLKTMAIAGAKTFADVWQFDDYWKRSNTFHSFLRFVDAAERRWGKGDPALQPMQDLRTTLTDANAAYFRPKIGNDYVWADDYGWCGLACMAAYDYLLSIGNRQRADEYAGLAGDCCDQMLKIGFDATDTATPVQHGCGNTSPDRKRRDGGHGTRNTVTNVNLLLLANRLYLLNGFPNYQDIVYKQASWFAEWFTQSYASLDNGPYLRTLSGPVSLVHERPMAKKTYVEDDYPGWERGWTWSGDQGLLLMALATIIRQPMVPPGFAPQVFKDAFVKLAAGVETLLFGGTGQVLHEPPFNSSFGEQYAGDYVGGRGVLLRYASEPIVTEALGRPLRPACIVATMQAVWDSRSRHENPAWNKPDVFDSSWDTQGAPAFNQRFVQAWGNGEPGLSQWQLGSNILYGVMQANGLDALTAAIRLETLV